MAYLEACDQKPIAQYLQSAILQLFNDCIPYNETLQVLGVLCVAVDDQVEEVVIKVNSTLKRINSLTPPKERSPDPKSTEDKAQPKNSPCNSGESVFLAVPNVNRTESNPSPINSGHMASHKSRGRKQSRPAKVESANHNAEEFVDENVDHDGTIAGEFGNEESRKRRYSFNKDEDELSVRNSMHHGKQPHDEIHIKSELHNKEQVGLDLSLFSRKQMKQEHEGTFPSSFNFDDRDEVVSTSTLHSAFAQHLTRGSPVVPSASKSHALLKHTPTMFTQPASSSSSSVYRRILPTSPNDLQFQLASNSFPTNSHSTLDGFEIKSEDDYLLDCLNADGKKRRRRSLDDALTADELLEYMGSQDRTEASFACRICGEITQDLLKYFHHTLLCHKAFICHQCGRCFTTKSSLLRHRPIHTGLRRFACGICHKAFYRKDKCKAHIKKHAEVHEEQDASFNLQVL